jgi:hypothetical protein
VIKIRTIFKRTLLLALGTTVLSSLSFATILCSSPTAISVITAAGGCAFGTNTFTNVSISTSTKSIGTQAGAIDPTQVALQITGDPALNAIDVTVSNLTASNWVVANTQQFTLILTYTVTGGLPAYFFGVGDSFNGSATTCSAGTTPCGDGAPSGAGAISFDKTADSTTLPTLSLGTLSQLPVAFGGAPLSTFDVTDNIQVHATNATATLTSATNSFVIPEPMTSVLLGSGLLAFGFMLRRKRN